MSELLDRCTPPLLVQESVSDMSEVLGTLHFGGEWPKDTNSELSPFLVSIMMIIVAGALRDAPAEVDSHTLHPWRLNAEMSSLRWRGVLSCEAATRQQLGC